MELSYVVMTIIKILISVPTVLLLFGHRTEAAALIGGHFDNRNSTKNLTNSYLVDYDTSYESQETTKNKSGITSVNSEEIPDPSALVLPGYNLPETIFNKGKPFYLEKDPMTGQIDFNSKTSTSKFDDDLYEYVDDEPSDNIYDKSNINRKDGSLSSHRPSDVNQLTPNFHDFLNLPVKYNPDKYVYPLISSSYANTKIQGNVNKYYNHKDYNVKTTTKKTTNSPTYYSTSNKNYFNSEVKTTTTKKPITTTTTTTVRTTTTQKPTTVQKQYTTKSSIKDVYITTKSSNLFNNAMKNPFNEEFNDYYETTRKPVNSNNIYLTTENINKIYLTTKAPVTSTKKEMSLFEQLFGEYDETVTTTERTVPPKLFSNLPGTKYTKNKYDSEIKTDKPSYTTPTYSHYPNSHAGPAGPNGLTGNMGIDSYEYDDYDADKKHEDNIAVENKPTKTTSKINSVYTVTTMKPVNEIIKPESTATKVKDNKNQTVTVVNSITKPTSTSTTTITTTTTTSTAKSSTAESEYDYEYEEKEPQQTTKVTTAGSSTTQVTPKVTSLPIGDNHVTSLQNRDPIIVAAQNLKEKLNSEMVKNSPFSFEKPIQNSPPSTSNVHIAHDQDTVSFVVGNHQNVDGGQYVGTDLKESPYDSNPFRPLYGQKGSVDTDSVSYSIQAHPEQFPPPPPPKFSDNGNNFFEQSSSSITIQPLIKNEASLSIGVPVGQKIPGQVVDDKLDDGDEKINEYPKGTGTKIVFPDEKDTTVTNLLPPPAPPTILPLSPPPSNREVLKLHSKPMYHQLPSELTPPREKDSTMPPRFERPRPPWDPRPGHFYSGKPEYNRPPRPSDIAFKRIDNLPNILPQFRPNTNKNHHHHHPPPQHYYRQPLLERPSNRPLGFFEKLQPPPPPPPHLLHNLHNLRKIPPPSQSLDDSRSPIAEDRIINEGPVQPRKPLRPEIQEQYSFFHPPPKVVIANRRNGDDDVPVETLQMIQAKQSQQLDKKDAISVNIKSADATNNVVVTAQPTIVKSNENNVEEQTSGSEKPLYVVYPVNTPPIKLDILDSNKKEAVVIGTRAELPLPPSKINSEFPYDQDALLIPKERHDAPVLKPHPRPSTFPIKSDFPYALERPDPSLILPAVPETPANNLDDTITKFVDDTNFVSSNQWNILGNNIESRIVNGGKVTASNPNQISATLKTYTEKPIAVAYTPTEPHDKNDYDDRFSMPNYGSSVIPEIRPGSIKNFDNNEFTVSAVMHTHPQYGLGTSDLIKPGKISDETYNPNHKMDTETGNQTPDQLDFQAPFQASANIDSSMNQGWAVVVKDKNNTSTEATAEVTTLTVATTSEFDIENFKPQLEGGFKPIYNFPDTDRKETEVNEREE